jgi:hypothetical protein
MKRLFPILFLLAYRPLEALLSPAQNLPYNKEKIIHLPLLDGVSVSRE